MERDTLRIENGELRPFRELLASAGLRLFDEHHGLLSVAERDALIQDGATLDMKEAISRSFISLTEETIATGRITIMTSVDKFLHTHHDELDLLQKTLIVTESSLAKASASIRDASTSGIRGEIGRIQTAIARWTEIKATFSMDTPANQADSSQC
eukprot:TRINITY_DN8764_c0_g1_i1.p1 TRINITY_DN8764_c0_g1~~TRINITY_DN8764_c0_g1_i1.p1  ORF type:complete len:155 (+),score=25.92 TRINITY_DN8764_c0_g1_i1:222-686(+)